MVRSRRGPPDQPPRTGPRPVPGRAGPSGPGRCWSWPPRPRPRYGPGGSASRRRPGSAWSPRCRGSGPRCTWTPPSLCRSAWRPTRRTRCAPGWPATPRSAHRTRRFAKWSAIFSFALGMAGQVAYHLMAQAGTARAPWPITTVVSCLPVLVLGMGTALAHLLRADAAAADRCARQRGRTTSCPAVPVLVPEGPGGTRPQATGRRTGTGPRGGTSTVPGRDHDMATGSRDLARGPPDRRRIRPA